MLSEGYIFCYMQGARGLVLILARSDEFSAHFPRFAYSRTKIIGVAHLVPEHSVAGLKVLNL